MRKLVACMLFLLMLLPVACLGESVAARYDLTLGDGTAQQSYTVAEYQEVALHISCDETTVFPGETVVFTVSVENGGAEAMKQIALSELSIGGGSWANASAQLAGKGRMTATYTVRIPDTLHDIALFQLQWQGGSMTAQHPLNVTEPLQLTVSAEVKEWPWQAGKEHSADFTVTNESDMVLENVALTLPGARLDGERIGDALFLRKDRRKLKSAQQTDAFLLESLDPGDSVTMTAAWTPDILPEGEVALTMQAAAEAAGRMQTRTATVVMAREVVQTTMWTVTIAGGVTMGHVLCGLAGLTLLTALAALLRARKLR